MAQNLKKTLTNRLTGAKKIAILAVGSDLRRDDSAGMLVAEELEKNLKKTGPEPRLKIFMGGTAPENLTGVIKRFKPSDILIVDALEMDRKPGEVILIDFAGLGGGVTFSTHTMPAKILADYFNASFKCRITMIGIQPKSTEFGMTASKNVVSSARNIARIILKAVKGLTN